MCKGYVIAHEDVGIYLGTFMGLGFWSKLDQAGQNSAPLFPTTKDAIEHIASWDEMNDPNDFIFLEIPNCDDEEYVTFRELIDHGFINFLGVDPTT